MTNNYCIHNLLKFICLMQDHSNNQCFSGSSCQKPFLGPIINSPCYNTRVVSLYQKNGELFSVTIQDTAYSYFRVMNVNETCCQLLILNNNQGNYTSTQQYITVDIHCIGAIRCIQDINL